MAGERRRVIAANSIRIVHRVEEMDMRRITEFILGSYWGRTLDAAAISTSFKNSFCVGLMQGDQQIAVARAISDQVIEAYLKDVVVFPEQQRQGFGRQIVKALFDHPSLKDVPKWYLGTKDAQPFYSALGFRMSPDGVYMHLTRD